MKDKMIKNIGIIVGTSNLAFASSVNGDKDELLKKAQETFKKFSKDNDEKKIKDFVDKLYSPNSIYIKGKPEKGKTNKYTLNKNVTKESLEAFFKGSFLRFDEKYKKILFIFKENFDISIIEKEDNNDEKIKSEYLKLLGTKGSNPTFISVEITPKDGKVETINLVKCTNLNEEKALRDKYQPEKPGEDNFDTKEVFEKAIAINGDVYKSSKDIINVLYNKKLNFGIHELGNNELNLDGYIIIKVLPYGKVKLSTTIVPFIEAKINTYISSVKLTGDNSEIEKDDIFIAQKQINGKKKLLIAKAEDVSKGKIGNNTIDKEFYKSSLEKFFDTVNKLSERENTVKDLIKIFIDDNYDCGQYQLDEATIKKFRSLISKDINLNNKGLEWICLRENETSGGSINTDVLKKNIDFSGKTEGKVDSNGMKTDCYIKENDIIVAVESNKNLLLIAKGSDISAGTVNGQTIDDSFYQPAK